MKVGHVNDTITVTLSRGDALAVGQTIRSLARSQSALPPGVDRQLFDRVGFELAHTAITAPTEPKP